MNAEARRHVSKQLAKLADDYEQEFDWPAAGLRVVLGAGWPGWVIPSEFGGRPQTAVGLLERYEMLGAGDLSVTLIVTQHDAAVDLIAQGENSELKRRLLPRFASGELQTTVGIAQLTTSRQGGRPAMAVARDSDGFRLNGTMPWVTGPQHASHIVTGGVLDDGSQLLACVPAGRAGVSIDPPFKLMGLNSSWTAAVHCSHVSVEPADVIRGPADKALTRRSPVKPFVVSSVGIGLASAFVELIDEKARGSEAELRDLAVEYRDQYTALRGELLLAAREVDESFRAPSHPGAPSRGSSSEPVPHRPDSPAPPPAELKTELRVAVNELLARLAIAAMNFAKGSGYVRGRRAERLAREALFMQVWSAPTDVRRGTLERLRDGARSRV
jgi:alkylation response protein AidB-like acyl-CoA dehydrogenase